MTTINRKKLNAVEAHIAMPQPIEAGNLIDMLCELVDFWPRCATCATQEPDGEIILWSASTSLIKHHRQEPGVSLWISIGEKHSVDAYYKTINGHKYRAKDWHCTVVTFEEFKSRKLQLLANQLAPHFELLNETKTYSALKELDCSILTKLMHFEDARVSLEGYEPDADVHRGFLSVYEYARNKEEEWRIQSPAIDRNGVLNFKLHQFLSLHSTV